MYEKFNQKVQKINLSERNLHKYFVFDENKKWTYFDIFRKNANFCHFMFCDWFCPMMSHIPSSYIYFTKTTNEWIVGDIIRPFGV